MAGGIAKQRFPSTWQKPHHHFPHGGSGGHPWSGMVCEMEPLDHPLENSNKMTLKRVNLGTYSWVKKKWVMHVWDRPTVSVISYSITNLISYLKAQPHPGWAQSWQRWQVRVWKSPMSWGSLGPKLTRAWLLTLQGDTISLTGLSCWEPGNQFIF